MATSARRDVKLVVETETIGEEGLRRLAGELRALAKAGGDAAPEAAALAVQLDRIAEQANALNGLKSLSETVEQLAVQQSRAAASASELAVDLAAQSERVDQLRAAQAEAVGAQRAATEALAQQRRELQELRASYDSAGRQTESYAALARAAREAVASAAAELRNKKAALTDLNGELSRAVTAERELGTEYRQVATQAAGSTQALREQRQALQDAEGSARALGLEVTDLAAAEQRLRAAQEETTAAVVRAQREQADALRIAAIESRGLAEAQERGRVAAEAELATIRESEEFIRRYDAAKAAASAEALRFVEALDREAVAAERAARRTAELDAAAARTAESAKYVKQLEAAFNDLDAATARAAAEQARFTAELDALDAQAAAVSKELADRNRQAAQAFEADQAALVQSIRAQAAATEQARAEALQYVEALDAQAAAAERAARRTAELDAAAEKTARDAEYVRSVAAAFDAVEAQARQAAAEVQRLQGYFAGLKSEAVQVNQAFGQTGVRSFEAIRREMLGVNQAVATLRGEFAAGSISAQDLGRAVSSAQVRLATLKREMETIPALPGTFERLGGVVNDLINRFGALGAAIATVAVAVRPAIEATIALDQMRRVLAQVTGSAQEAGRQIEFVRDVSQRAGQSVTEVGQAYSKFAASALQAGLSNQQVSEAFAAVTLAAGNLGLGTEQAKRALEALSQMAAKSVVGMEELRQQLGDALPGVLPLLAKELGLTTQQLNKVVESGGLLANEAIPAISRSLRALGPVSGEVDGLVAAWARFKNVLSETSTIIGDGALGKALGAGLGAVGFVVERLAFGVAFIGESFTVVGKQIGVTVAAIVSRDFKNLNAALAEIEAESSQKLAALASRIEGTGTAATSAAPPVRDLGTAAQATAAGFDASAAAAGKSAQANAAVVASTQQAAAASASLAVESAKAAAAATAQAASAASGARSFAQLGLSMAEAEKAAVLAAQSAEKHTQATKDGAAAIARAVEISGDDVAAKQAQARASVEVARASEAQARADQAVVDTLRQSRTATEDYGRAHGFTAQQIEDVTKKLDEKIAKATADAEKSREAAAAARAEAAARQLNAEVLRDNSTRLAEYSLRLQESSTYLARVRQQYIDGKASLEQLQAATTEASRAQRLFRDALADTEAALARRTAAAKADGDVTRAGLTVKLEEAKAAERAAQILGQETTQRQASIRQREIELEIQRSQIAEKRNEAEETIRVATEQLRELEAKSLLTPELRTELELRIRSAEAKRLDAQAGEVAARVTEREIEILKRSTVALNDNIAARSRGGGGGGGGGRLDQNGLDSQGRNADGLRPSSTPGGLSGSVDQRNSTRLTSPERTYDSAGFATNPDGSRITGGTNLPKPPGEGWQWVAELNQGWPYGGYWKRGNEIYSGTPGNTPVNRDGLFNRPFGGFGLITANPGSGTFRFDGTPEPYNNRGVSVGGIAPKPAEGSGSNGREAFDAAYGALGLSSPGQSGDEVATATAAFNLIMSDGRASIETKRAAFAKYAQLVLRSTNGAVTDDLGRYARELGVSLGQETRDANFNTAGGLTKNTVSVADPAQPPAAPSPSAPGTNHTVTITIGGRPTVINTATAGDADALAGLLASLETAAGRSS